MPSAATWRPGQSMAWPPPPPLPPTPDLCALLLPSPPDCFRPEAPAMPTPRYVPPASPLATFDAIIHRPHTVARAEAEAAKYRAAGVDVVLRKKYLDVDGERHLFAVYVWARADVAPAVAPLTPTERDAYRAVVRTLGTLPEATAGDVLDAFRAADGYDDDAATQEAA